eukprot:TRINITY_DN13027_c0_g1_i1.p1 TRINITY_DN13027_c0_g1~~TRINITY_DN13027_c0_g1_i1.p1  ORF type:complete len:732 (+),score=161.67 TRINITY_DN13027_c0_g1_i1:645-2840(+)
MSLADEVNKLKALLDEGILTNVQFEDAKDAVIRKFAESAACEFEAHHGHGDQYVIHLFWDVSNCPLGENDRIAPLLHELKSKLKLLFSKLIPGWDPHTSALRGQFYLNAKVSNGLMSSKIEDLRDVGLTHVDPGEKRGGDDHKMISDITQLASDPTIDSSKVVVVVITGDRDFSGSLRALQTNGFDKTVVIHNGNARPAFLSNAMFSLNWQDLRNETMEKYTLLGPFGSPLYYPSEQKTPKGKDKDRRRSPSPSRRLSPRSGYSSGQWTTTDSAFPRTPKTPRSARSRSPSKTPPKTPVRVSPDSEGSPVQKTILKRTDSKGQSALAVLKQAGNKASAVSTEPLVNWLDSGDGIGIEKATETVLNLHIQVLAVCDDTVFEAGKHAYLTCRTSAALYYDQQITVYLEPLLQLAGTGVPSYKTANLLRDVLVLHNGLLDLLKKPCDKQIIFPDPISITPNEEYLEVFNEFKAKCVDLRTGLFSSVEPLAKELLNRKSIGDIDTLPVAPSEDAGRIILREVVGICKTHPELSKAFAGSLSSIAKRFGNQAIYDVMTALSDATCFPIANLLSENACILSSCAATHKLVGEVLVQLSRASEKKITACLILLENSGEDLDTTVEGILAVDQTLGNLIEQLTLNKFSQAQHWNLGRVRTLRDNGWRSDGKVMLHAVSARKLKKEIKNAFKMCEKHEELKKLAREQYGECIVDGKVEFKKLTYGRAHALLREVRKLDRH